MVAYSFKPRFVEPIRTGTKRQTIRADRKRHARAGEQLQLYTGMRTKHCQLIGRSECLSVWPVTLILREVHSVVLDGFRGIYGDLDGFARADGFKDWAELAGFWSANHPGVEIFDGVLIRWGDLA
ncbi:MULTISPECIES: hypothetical protein [unclassified Mesorhizobium]|uniref:hypothetical protein n=2 Tax=Mesorhizobium TaxID=68287 RepID=UPI000FCA461A|nr:MULTISPECIES: hypothetical protein [unclassified Mesorhizobium]TGP22354.1 hypothetical protein EN874_019795 [Mesorhizobium sp. M1D.F.Ca.ET.231.01.1.1]TGP24676.1 hypothetical protein EN877_30400 [Mesorhizobium sp. M1D.F.Ca.ET.234.01.1.1]TGS37279.1 hypothetical protein EN827_30705 [Mesorhizobium sp. M1D.F.Ca.ET.184.01.1.1]TGS58079.1 hypothetical protein EN826_030680 [Mesorhizobium sp. M1D.F.Ca.ET.183.01.1.1]